MGMFRLPHRIAVAASLIVPLVVSAAASAQTPLPQPAKTAIDNFSGFLFYCKPLASIAWTEAWCGQMRTEMSSWAARAKRPVALLNMTDTRARHEERARAAGFDPKHGLWFLLTLDQRTTAPAGLDLNARADGIAAGQPSTQPSQTTTYSKSELLSANTSPDEAAARGKRIIGTIMTALTTPMRPL
jgi:hypothetical protein